ncbi:signal peptidase I [Brevibacillus massiliensis]|jgi:signal peptidase I|uniref:signal peptidase I n=1 Tax=Brevibacillus massiliensis TaxID=1118054 RepID=UPI0002FBB80C|nr:signal peptidase I [Brevibacillus massiliensis]
MSEEATSSRGKSEAWEWIKALAIAIVLALLIRGFLFAPFIVEGESMESTLHNEEKLVVNKAVYYLHPPERGDIIVFHAEAKRDYIKRVIGLAGDTVEMRNDTLYINGQPVDEPYLAENKQKAEAAGLEWTADFQPVKIPEGYIWVMGDNRPNSKDSRMIGPVELKAVVGRAEFVFWPLGHIRMTR